MKKIKNLGLVLLLFSLANLLYANDENKQASNHSKVSPPYIEAVNAKNLYELTVLMDEDHSPNVGEVTKINEGHFNHIFGEIKKAKRLITNPRSKIGIPNNSEGLMPDEIEKQKIGYPDLKLLHPHSISARLQRYIVLTYKNEKQLQQAKERLLKNPHILSVSDSRKHLTTFSISSNDPLSLDLDGYQYGLFDS